MGKKKPLKRKIAMVMPSHKKKFLWKPNQFVLYARDYKETGDAKEEKECYSFHFLSYF